MRYQHYGVDAAGLTTHAGTHAAEANDFATAIRIQAEWEAWRESYLSSNPGPSPLRETAEDPSKRTVELWVEEQGKPETCQRFLIHEPPPVEQPTAPEPGRHTPGWDRFGCGCEMRSTGSPDAIEWKACPLHGAAPELRNALEMFLEQYDHGPESSVAKRRSR